ncbi:hypothetical protein ACFLYO_06140 [Chloroflexota bacterium]
MVATAVSKNGIPIRLTDERWQHIVVGHSELVGMKQEVLDTIAKPERILAGNEAELLAIHIVETGKWLVVIYRELEADGFVITAFLTRRERSLNRRLQVWP